MRMWKAIRNGAVVFIEVLIGRRCVVCHKDNLTQATPAGEGAARRYYRECRDCGAKMDVPSALL